MDLIINASSMLEASHIFDVKLAKEFGEGVLFKCLIKENILDLKAAKNLKVRKPREDGTK